MSQRRNPSFAAVCLIGLATVVVLSALAWEGFLKDRLVPRRWGVIEEGVVYRSGQLSRHLVGPMLRRHDIRRIVDLTEVEPDNPDEAAEHDTARELGVEIVSLPLSGDGRGDIEHYAETIQAICDAVESGEPLLVHCAAGTQRTGGVTACYRTLVQEESVDSARREMERFGWDPERDHVLSAFLNEKMGELAALLVDRGIIERAPDPLPSF